MHGENSCPPIPIPIIQIPTIHFNFQRPIRLQTNRFNCGSVDLHPTYSHPASNNTSVCYRVTLDFSKAFDCVRHATLLGKMADLDIPDNVYNWLVSYFSQHSHCTKYDGLTSTFLEISAGIMQGSGMGPASYVVNSSNLKAIMPGNSLCKYADDTYLIIPSANEDRVGERRAVVAD